MHAMFASLSDWETSLQDALSQSGLIGDVFTLVARFFFPILALFIFFRCLWPLMSGGRRPRPWAHLVLQNDMRIPLVHWENAVGRGKNCDVVLDFPSISREHAVITRKKDGWYIVDVSANQGVTVNGTKCDGMTRFFDGDRLGIGDVTLTMLPVQGYVPEREPRRLRFATRAAEIARNFRPGVTLFYLLIFQLIGLVSFCLSMGQDFNFLAPGLFLGFMVVELVYFLATRGQGRRYIEPELLAFFLCGIGLFVSASVSPQSMITQLGAIVLGLLLFLLLTFLLNNTDRARTARYVFAGGAILLLLVNLLLAQINNGARNWIEIGGINFQPSEFVKVAFVFVGASTLDRLLTRRNLFLFMGFAGVCVLALVWMRDFGAAAIFFTTFLVMAFMRSGDFRTLGIALGVTGAGAFIAVSFMPYIAARFAAWRHVWDFADTTGYQQTRTMVYTASGGMLGVGAGNGYLRNVAAANTDLVFGVVSEEWGLIIAMVCALAPLALAIFVGMSVKASRSSFYAITACGAAVILLMQAALNIFGSLDILPLTGVTLPFVSTGGSSMVACWGLLACIKSIDERHRAAQ